MDGLIENIKIAGIASCVPRHTEDNMDYGNVLGEKRVKKQVKLTGIRKRHTSRIEQRASDLAVCAANDLLTKLDWEKDDGLVKELEKFIYQKSEEQFNILVNRLRKDLYK